ncbi:cytochrome P450 [Bradyrhizobium sp. HKCCYLS20291]|uniref:cytochrome P450 n=1 Tax=Bradyrhizobium sp. HKCCYLS20291 TaxID=3420766 RepID=UPI003EBB42AA
MAEPPGPRGTQLFAALNDWRKNGLVALEHLAQQYGDIVCAKFPGRRFYMLNHPDYIRHVLIDNRDNYLRSEGSRRERRFFGNSMQVNNGDEARRLRRIIGPMFQQSLMARDYCRVVVDLTRSVVDGWTTFPSATLMDELMQVALSASVQIHFGTRPGAETDELATLFREADEFRTHAALPEWVPTTVNRKYLRAIERLNRDVFARIKARRASGPVGADLLSAFVSLPDEGLTDVEIRDSLVSTTAAGADGIGIALNQTIRQIALNPAIDDALHAEAAEVLDGRPVRYDDLVNLPYAEQVVKEALRLVPPSGAMVRIAAGADEIGGWRIPRGSRMLISSWVMHRDARWFGDPYSFKPERWTAEFERSLPTCAYLPFGRGPRTCIGAPMATLMLRLMLVTIAQRHRPRATDPERAIKIRPFNRADDYLPVVLEAR